MSHWPRHSLLAISLLLFATSGCAGAPPARDAYGTQAATVKVAQQLIGTPYVYGGHSPERGFDCSGLVYYSHAQAGQQLPRTVLGQYRSSRPVLSRELRPGDLVFFRTTRQRVSHVGIYLGEGRFVHAPSSGKAVTVGSFDQSYWRKRFIRGGRF